MPATIKGYRLQPLILYLVQKNLSLFFAALMLQMPSLFIKLPNIGSSKFLIFLIFIINKFVYNHITEQLFHFYY